MPKAVRLAELKIDEVSGVDFPANEADGWLVLKAADIAFHSKKPQDAPAVPPTMGENMAIKKEDLAEDVRKFVEDLEAKVTKAETDAAEAATKAADAEKALADVKPKEDEAVDKATLSEPVRKALEAAEQKATALEAKVAEEVTKAQKLADDVQKMQRDARHADYVAKAKDLANLGAADQVGTLLMSVADSVDEATYKSLEQILKAANARMDGSDILLKQLGSATGSEDTAVSKITKAAKTMAAEKGITFEQAKVEVMKDPELRAEVYAEIVANKG